MLLPLFAVKVILDTKAVKITFTATFLIQFKTKVNTTTHTTPPTNCHPVHQAIQYYQ